MDDNTDRASDSLYGGGNLYINQQSQSLNVYSLHTKPHRSSWLLEGRVACLVNRLRHKHRESPVGAAAAAAAAAAGGGLGGAGVISQRRSTETVAVPLCGRIGVGPSEVLGPGPNNGFGLTSDGVEFGLFDRRGDETCLCLSNREVLASFKWGPR